MDKEEFKTFKKNVIRPYIDEILKLDSDVGCITCCKSKINNIFVNYEKYRRYIRHYFMDLEEKPMDRHKIASVMMKSVLKSRVLKVNRLIKNIPLELLMANELLSFYIAIGIIESYRTDKLIEEVYGKNIDLDISELVEFQFVSSLCMPHLYHGVDKNASSEEHKEVYILNTCKALYYLETPNDFDIFAYANILFLLEAYTDFKRKEEIEAFIKIKKSEID